MKRGTFKLNMVVHAIDQNNGSGSMVAWLHGSAMAIDHFVLAHSSIC